MKDRISEYLIRSGIFEQKYVDAIVTYTILGLLSLYQLVFVGGKMTKEFEDLSAFMNAIVMNGIVGIENFKRLQ